MPSGRNIKLQQQAKALAADGSSGEDDGASFEEVYSEEEQQMSELDDSEQGSQVEEIGESEDDYNEGELEFSEDEMEEKRRGLEALIDSAKPGNSSETPSTAPVQQKNKGRGLVYLSWIPALMKAHHLREYLSELGDVNRIWIEIPDAIKNAKNISKRKMNQMVRTIPKEAWVEFERAKKAYKAAKLLHCSPMGRGAFKQHMWNIKYLKNFSWSDLVTQHLHRKKMRESRLRQSLSRAKQEASKILENHSKQEHIDKRKKRPRPEGDGEVRHEHAEAPKRNIPQHAAPAKSSKSDLLDNSLLSKVRSTPNFKHLYNLNYPSVR